MIQPIKKSIPVHILYTAPEICESCARLKEFIDYQCACKCRYNNVYKTTKCRYMPINKKAARSGNSKAAQVKIDI